jgi:hypothetical protein
LGEADGIVIGAGGASPIMLDLAAPSLAAIRIDDTGEATQLVTLDRPGNGMVDPLAAAMAPNGVMFVAGHLPGSSAADLLVTTNGAPLGAPIGGNHTWLVAIAANGTVLFTKELPFTGSVSVHSLLATDDAIYVEGDGQPGMVFGAGEATETTLGADFATVIAKYDQVTGAFRWLRTFYSLSDRRAQRISGVWGSGPNILASMPFGRAEIAGGSFAPRTYFESPGVLGVVTLDPDGDVLGCSSVADFVGTTFQQF